MQTTLWHALAHAGDKVTDKSSRPQLNVSLSKFNVFKLHSCVLTLKIFYDPNLELEEFWNATGQTAPDGLQTNNT